MLRAALTVWGTLTLLTAGAQASQPDFELEPAPSYQLDEAHEPLPAEPLQTIPQSLGGFSVDTSNRADVVSFFETVYAPQFEVPIQWTGDVDMCMAGTTSAAHSQAALDLVNYFRAMAGLSADVVFDATLSGKCQEAALMMSAQNDLSHSPMQPWACFTADGQEAAGDSNLALGIEGPSAMDAYMEDPGPFNNLVGHRRWILFPPQTTMGTGDIESAPGRLAANCLYVIDQATWGPLQPQDVAWPPEGFVPYPVVYPRWSFQADGADFESASVTMLQGVDAVALEIVGTVSQPPEFLPQNVIVWEPDGLVMGPGVQDTTYSVQIDYTVSGSARSALYDVTVIDPEIAPEPSAALAVSSALVTLSLLARGPRSARAV